MDDTWEQRMAARAKERREARGELPLTGTGFIDRLNREMAEIVARDKVERPERYLPTPPPDHGECLNCCAWKADGSFGRYTWWCICGYLECPCSCHPEPIGHRYTLGAASSDPSG